MSTVYNTEPQPTGSVILHTTRGELSIELFAKQTPLTCRNFLQLCLDGYYDNTLFHRLVPAFILQGGDPTGTGSGGESIYDGGAFCGEEDAWPADQRKGRNAGPMGVGFRDEIHSRLKFNRRGLLGMANEARPDTNGSQFFLTLAKADELNGKNTMFGRIAGDTIYNLAKIGEGEVEEGTDRPVYPVRLERVEIVLNPFATMSRRVRRVQAVPRTIVDRTKKRKKGGRQLLSFTDDHDENDDVSLKKSKRMVTPVLQSEAARNDPEEEDEKAPDRSLPPETAASSEPILTRGSGLEGGDGNSSRTSRKVPLRQRSKSPHEKVKSELDRTNEQIAALKASMRRSIQTTETRSDQESTATMLERLVPKSAIRGRKKNAEGKLSISTVEEERTLRLLQTFRSKLGQVPTEHDAITREPKPAESGHNPAAASIDATNVAGAGEEAELCDLHFIADCGSCQAWGHQERAEETMVEDQGWMSHSLTFAADRLGKDLRTRRKAEEDFVVIDPRERERTIKEERRADRQAARAGSSGGAQDWWGDQARNAQMARLASLAGRGAK